MQTERNVYTCEGRWQEEQRALDNGAPVAEVHPGPKKLAFVFSGGGTLGCIQVGVAEALLEYGIYPDLIVGTSVGALNGAWLALYPHLDGIRRLKEIWASLKADSIFTGGHRLALLRLLLGRDHLYTNEGLRELITRLRRDITFEDLSLPLYVTAADLDTGELAVFHEGPLAPAILASTAIPGVFPSVTIDGHAYFDGGVLSSCCIEAAWKGGATHIVVIHCPSAPPKQGYGILGPIGRALWASVARLCQLEVERFQERCPTLFLCPEVDIGPFRLKDLSRTVKLMEQAKRWTAETLRNPVNVSWRP